MKRRSGWLDVSMRICFEESEMEVLLRSGKRQKRPIVTPIFLLPDGTEFTGRRASEDLRKRIAATGKPKTT